MLTNRNKDMNVKEELLNVVRDYMDAPESEIDTSVGLKYSGLNSYAVLAMVSAIEDRFDVSISDETLRSFNTLDDIISYLER